MKWLKGLDKFLKEAGIPYKEDETLSPYTTIKIGGPALRVVYPEGCEAFKRVLNFLSEEEIPFFVVGGGSNLLVSDEGFQGVVVMTRGLRGMQVLSRGETLRLSVLAGTRINELIRFSLAQGYGGFEFLGGVPATLGGAIRMNAGAFGKTTSLLVKRVFLFQEGEVKEFEPAPTDWTYRAFKREGIILEAHLELEKLTYEEIKRRLRESWKKRRTTQPVSERTFGSVFKNPPCCYAGALIEQCGLKGTQIGGAKISEKHANFIVNTGGAKAKEVLSLMKLARAKVWENFRITLEPEVKFLGVRDDWLS